MRYTIGQWVWVSRVVTAFYGRGVPERKCHRELFAEDAGWPAVVCGATRIKLGVRTQGTDGFYGMEGYEPGEPTTFEVNRTVLVYTVRRGVTNKPMKALPQHLSSTDPSELPWFYSSDPGGWKYQKRAQEIRVLTSVVKALGPYEICGFCGGEGEYRLPTGSERVWVVCKACRPSTARPLP